MSSLAQKVYDICYLTGEFTLRSGTTATHYFDKYLFEGDPDILREVARAMVPLVPAGTEVLAGLEMGGIPIATALSLETGLPAAFVRKEAKPYGTCKTAEGASVADRRTLIIEDVVTTGGQIVLSTADLRADGADIVGALCVIVRNDSAFEKLAEEHLKLMSLFTTADFPDQ